MVNIKKSIQKKMSSTLRELKKITREDQKNADIALFEDVGLDLTKNAKIQRAGYCPLELRDRNYT